MALLLFKQEILMPGNQPLDASPRAGIGRKAMSDPQIDSETI